LLTLYVSRYVSRDRMLLRLCVCHDFPHQR